MKAAAFEYARPHTVAEAVGLLAAHADAKILAGGQTLGPMLNLRLARPSMVIDVSRIAELGRVEDMGETILLGACVTHASIEDGRVPDPGDGALSRVAKGIAYRAVRTRGTIGGSIAHADPAADWLSLLVALDATVLIANPARRSNMPLAAFVAGALTTRLAPDEMIVGIRIPKLASSARVGYAKISQKTGEFAKALGVAVRDPSRATLRLVAGALAGPPVVMDFPHSEFGADERVILSRLAGQGLENDVYRRNIHLAALQRALRETEL